jgi:hypothetical protein
MDWIVTGVIAVMMGIIAVLIALITKKKLRKILIYAVSGLIIGIPVGYLLAPVMISFF